MVLLWEALGHRTGREEEFAIGAVEPTPQVEPEMMTAFQQAQASLRRAGVSLRPVDISAMLSQLSEASDTVMFYEGARFHQERFNEYGDRLHDLAALVRDGLQIPVERYDEARRYISESKARIAERYKVTPVILAPAATGPAPLGLASTGDARMNAPWTALGTPAISVPMPVGKGLPLGLQLTADHGQDARVLRTAVRLHRILNAK
jgi:Asp-tRNA(Asn)/Glu-tRNA(Gln) amidotransferase A subunit family amidase